MTHILEGKTLTGMKLAEDKKAILFETDGENIIAKADGDCCSDTWVESVELPALGFPAKVISAQDLEMPGQDEEFEYGLIQHYGFKIATDKGDIVIDYRNESNGYYGGNLSWPDDGDFYGGVFGQNISKEEWREIQGYVSAIRNHP